MIQEQTYKCKECEKELTKDNFYKDISCKYDIRTNKCKKCNSEEYYLDSDRLKEYQRQYYQDNRKDILLRGNKRDAEKYWSNEVVRNKEKCRARTRYNIKAGKLVRPNECSLCKGDAYPQPHHKNYDDSMIVTWVCGECHKAIHQKYPTGQRSSSFNIK